MKIGLPVNRSTRLLAGTSAGLAAVIAVQLSVPASPSDMKLSNAATEDSVPASAMPAYVPRAFENFSEVLDRPLFFADRKLPPPAAIELAAAAPREPLRLELEGIALSGASRVALLRDQKTNSLVQVEQGMTHSGWMLEDLSSDRAVFRRNDELTELELDTGSERR